MEPYACRARIKKEQLSEKWLLYPKRNLGYMSLPLSLSPEYPWGRNRARPRNPTNQAPMSDSLLDTLHTTPDTPLAHI